MIRNLTLSLWLVLAVLPASGQWINGTPPSIDPKYGGNTDWNDAWRSVRHDSTNDNASNAAVVDFAKTTAFTYRFIPYTGKVAQYQVRGTVCVDAQGVYQPVLYTTRPYQHCLWISQTGQLAKNLAAATGSASGPSGVGSSSLCNWLGSLFFFYESEGWARIRLVGTTGPNVSPNDDLWGDSTSNGTDVFCNNTLRAHGPPVGFWCIHPNGTVWSMQLSWDTSLYGMEWAGDTNSVFISLPLSQSIYLYPNGLYCKSVTTGKTIWFLRGVEAHNLVVSDGNLYSKDALSKTILARSGEDGRILWQYATPYPILAVAGNVVLTMNASNRLVALRKDTGAVLWMASVTRVDGLAVAKGSGTFVLTSYVSYSHYATAIYDLATGVKVAGGPVMVTTNPQPLLIGNRMIFADSMGITAIDSPKVLVPSPIGPPL